MDSIARRQAGATIIELMVAIAVLLIGIVAFAAYTRSEQQAATEALAATHLQAFAGAADRYMVANEATLRTSTASGVRTFTAAQLNAYLPANVNVVGPLGHEYALRVRQSGGQLQGLLLSRTAGTGAIGLRIRISRLAGEAAGYSLTNSTLESPAQSWRIRANEWTSTGWGAPAPAIGSLAYALFYDQASRVALAGSVLHRRRMDTAPHLNRMETAIDMAGNELAGVGVLTAERLETRIGSMAEGFRAGNVAIGRTPFVATSYPYETIQVPLGNTLRFYGGSTELMSGNQNAIAFRRPTTLDASANAAGQANIAGSVDARSQMVTDGDMQTEGWIRTWGNQGLYSETYGGGWHMTDPSWVRSYNNRGLYTGGTVQSGNMVSTTRTVNQNATIHGGEYVGGSSTVAGDSSEQGQSWVGSRATPHDLLARRTVQCNAACGANETGVLARTGDGTPAACMSGQWKCLGDGTGGSGGGGSAAGCACPGMHATGGVFIEIVPGSGHYSAQGQCRGAQLALNVQPQTTCEWQLGANGRDVCWSIVPRTNRVQRPTCSP